MAGSPWVNCVIEKGILYAVTGYKDGKRRVSASLTGLSDRSKHGSLCLRVRVRKRCNYRRQTPYLNHIGVHYYT